MRKLSTRDKIINVSAFLITIVLMIGLAGPVIAGGVLLALMVIVLAACCLAVSVFVVILTLPLSIKQDHESDRAVIDLKKELELPQENYDDQEAN